MEALNGNLKGTIPQGLLADFEELMVQLGVLPSDEDELPPEDPSTF
ncbi:MAG: hypothetical protein ACFFD4_31520 [Candidatus Odinarchaeota archaeon]